MESSLTYLDDTFDGNYDEYNTELPLWSSDSVNLGFQLTETMHDILPFAPRDDVSANLINNSLLKGDCLPDKKLSINNQLLRYENSGVDENLKSNLLSSLQAFENPSLHENYKTDANSIQSSNIDSSCTEEDSVLSDGFYNASICSGSTFRSRTDSSSIGDYESHSSDYEEEEDSSDKNKVYKTEDDQDPFAMQLDVNTFDLAAFITSDEHIDNSASSMEQTLKLQRNIQTSKNKFDSESDSDVIVDVETFENDEASFVESNQINNANSLVKCDYFYYKSKSNTFEKNKETKKPERHISIPLKNVKSVEKKLKSRPVSPNNLNPLINEKTGSYVSQRTKENAVCKYVLNTRAEVTRTKPQGEKNLRTEEQSRYRNVSEWGPDVINSDLSSNKGNSGSLKQDLFPKKRKLDLTEYKKRQKRKYDYQNCDSIKTNDKITEVSVKPVKPLIIPNSSLEIQTTISDCISSIVRPSIGNRCSKTVLDPITEAKMKALRAQELKKAQHIKAINSAVSSKVARVTKLLPLEEIVNISDKQVGNVVRSMHYEEIITFSVACNTDITFAVDMKNVAVNSLQTQLRYNELLTEIRDSFQKISANERVNITSNSLLTSINDVVVKKTSPQSLKLFEVSSEDMHKSQLAEDKIIMHLRKDRIRTLNPSQTTQTDFLPEFPVLQLLKHQETISKFSHIKKDTVSLNLESESESFSKITDVSQKLSRELFHKCSRSKCSDQTQNRKPISRTLSSGPIPNKDFNRNVSAPAVEERRIVYVGRIEPETTRETLRRKFASYGSIKQITIRNKDSGLNYGFVTFANSEDAFKVIDNYQSDVSINMYDISFGGRRAFCRSSYADLDNAGLNLYKSYPSIRQVTQPVESESFEVLLSQMKAKLQAV